MELGEHKEAVGGKRRAQTVSTVSTSRGRRGFVFAETTAAGPTFYLLRIGLYTHIRCCNSTRD